MYQEQIGEKPVNRNYGEDMDSLIRIRDRAKIDLIKSRMALLNLGVKTESLKEGSLAHLPGLNLNQYLAQGRQEFGWEAVLKDGTVLKQFEGKRQNHYGNIDQELLQSIRWVSCFEDATDNKEKRVIAELDFETGKFEFLNGFCPQEVRAEAIKGYPENFTPKLILKMVKRTATSMSYPEGNAEEVAYYYRYLLGWEGTKESATQAKRIICVEPNGLIHIWHYGEDISQ